MGRFTRSTTTSHRPRSAALSEAIFRTSSDYQLVLLDRLPWAMRKELASRATSDLYGLLLPAVGELPLPKAVDRETALLLFSLQEAGRMPEYVRRRPGWEREAARLVLDGAIEVEVKGVFLTGSAAMAFLGLAQAGPDCNGRLSAISEAALRYAGELRSSELDQLALRLYTYNSVPLTRRWREHLEDPRRFAGSWLGLAHREMRAMLERDWEPEEHGPESTWIGWERRGMTRPRPAARHKLYVSPIPDELPHAFATCMRTLADTPAMHIKVGRDAYNVLRPDKLVVYFHRSADAAKTATRLAAALQGISAQGVPFSTAIDRDGLISAATDPAADLLLGGPAGSWRQWVTERLAMSLVTGRGQTEHAGVPAWQFALERIRAHGVDTRTWSMAHPSGSSG